MTLYGHPRDPAHEPPEFDATEPEPEAPTYRTPPHLLATDPRTAAEPPWFSLAASPNPTGMIPVVRATASDGPAAEEPASVGLATGGEGGYEPVPEAIGPPLYPAMSGDLELTVDSGPPPLTRVVVDGSVDRPAVDLSTIQVTFQPDPVIDDDEIVPWDRKPLMVVIAGGLALILLGVLSVFVSASYFGRDSVPVNWHSVTGRTSPAPTGGPVVPPVTGGTITLSGVGDVIMGTQPGDLPPRAGVGFFDPVKDALAADLVMGNLETPLTEDTGRVKCATETPSPGPGNPSPSPTKVSGCHQFYLPPSYAKHLRDAGFQLMNLANNHTHDMGMDGLRRTREALDAVGVKHTGAPNQITYLEVKGVKVAVIGFAVYSWTQNLNNISAAQTLVRKAAAQADLVVIQMQGGAEGSDKSHVKPGMETYFGEQRGDLIKFSHAVVDAGADVVFGHGPHIMRGMEFYKGRLIAYSLGNFCGYGVLSSSGYLGVGGVLKITLKKDGSWAGGQLVATEMVKGGMVAVDTQRRALSFVNRLSQEDFGSSAARIGSSDGVITAPRAT